MLNGLEKILNLAKKTGDNVIVFNPAKPQDSYVILALNAYERLVDSGLEEDFLTEDDLDDKINRDIAPWEMNEGGFFKEEENEEFAYPDNKDFLPEGIFGSNQDHSPDFENISDAPTPAEAMEDEWEEEVNYLYPIEDKFVAAENESAEVEQKTDFDSVANILESKKESLNNWNASAEPDNLKE